MELPLAILLRDGALKACPWWCCCIPLLITRWQVPVCPPLHVLQLTCCCSHKAGSAHELLKVRNSVTWCHGEQGNCYPGCICKAIPSSAKCHWHLGDLGNPTFTAVFSVGWTILHRGWYRLPLVKRTPSEMIRNVYHLACFIWHNKCKGGTVAVLSWGWIPRGQMMSSCYRMTLCALVNLPKDTVLNSPSPFHGLFYSSLVLLYKSGITSSQLCFLLQKIYRTGLGGMPSPVMESPMGSVLWM